MKEAGLHLDLPSRAAWRRYNACHAKKTCIIGEENHVGRLDGVCVGGVGWGGM